MHNSRLALTPFDQEIERTARAIRKAVKEANIAQGILAEDQPPISSDSEEEITMKVIPP